MNRKIQTSKRRQAKAIEMVQCRDCEIHKPETEEHYYFRSNGKRDGLRCRPCHSRDKNADNRRVRDQVLEAYGWACGCCGEARYEFLEIDHVNGDGAAHRREVGGALASLRDIIKQGFPDKYQVLCANCNRAKGADRICPHQTEREAAITQAHRRVA
jgi:hypothetical protein